jgi:hypothetical protein
MDISLYKKVLEVRANDVFELNKYVYLIDLKDFILYIDGENNISEYFNSSMKYLFLLFDGELTLIEVFNKFRRIFDFVDEDTFLIDFVSGVNVMERKGVIVSQKIIDRYRKINKHKRVTTDKYLSSLKNNYREVLNV